MSTVAQWAYLGGKYVRVEDATISIRCQVVNYGIGAFGGIRAYWNADREQLYVFRLKDHVRRFLNSAKLFRATLVQTPEQIEEIVIGLLLREGYQENAYVRPLLFSATQDIKPRLYDVEFAFGCFSQAFGDYLPLNGTSAMTSTWARQRDTVIPSRGKITGAYVNAAFAKSEAHWLGFDDAILLNADGHVAEGSAMNLFIVRGGTLITPPVSDGILEGITRNTVMTLAREDGIEVIERPVDRSELYIADEVFFCGTGVQVAPVSMIDSRQVGDGKIGEMTVWAQRRYFEAVRGDENSRHPEWLTPVYGTN